MIPTTPLIFKASVAQRAIAIILAMGCLLIATYGFLLMTQNFPKMLNQLKLAQSNGGEPTTLIWLSIVTACIAMLFAGIILLLTILGLILIEGTQIIVDELGVTVKCQLLPKPIAKKFGAGHIQWKNIAKIERHGIYFVLRGEAGKNSPSKEIVKFLFADQLERLIFLIIERSPNLKLDS